MATETRIELSAGIDVQELSDRFNGPNFAVGHPRRGTTLAQLGAELAEEVVDTADDCYDKALEVRGRPSRQQTGVAGYALLQDCRGARDLKTRTPG